MTDDLPIVKSIKMVRESDIVERLQKKYSVWDEELYIDAADEIERLQAEVEEWKQAARAEASERRMAHDEIKRLRTALRPFAEIAKLYVNDTDQEVIDNVDRWEFVVSYPDLKKAYKALGEKE